MHLGVKKRSISVVFNLLKFFLLFCGRLTFATYLTLPFWVRKEELFTSISNIENSCQKSIYVKHWTIEAVRVSHDVYVLRVQQYDIYQNFIITLCQWSLEKDFISDAWIKRRHFIVQPSEKVEFWSIINFWDTSLRTIYGIIAQRYVDQILRPHIGPFAYHRSYVFRQDNAARVTMDFLCQNHLNLAVASSLLGFEPNWIPMD